MDSILSVAISAAQIAGEVIQRGAGDLAKLQVEQKELHDYVSEVDRESEAQIRAIVAKHFPQHAFMGEEHGFKGDHAAEYQWIVDPLDGTTNFLRGIPHYAVSIAVTQHAKLLHAVVYDPSKDELFVASKGGGASLNGQVIRVIELPNVRSALLATGVPFSGQNLAEVDSFSNTMQALLAKQTSGIRRLGSAALDLAYVAAGRYDGYWEAMLKPWDIAAGVLLVEEAGGRVASFDGGDSYLESGDIVAGSAGLVEDMLLETSRFYRR